MIVKSDSISKLANSLRSFQSNIGKIKKSSANPFFKSKYASLSDILDVIGQPLNDAGLVLTQLPDEDKLTTLLVDSESGEFIQSSYTMPVAKQNDPQALGSSITYARRYAIGAILVLNIDDDDDGNAASNRNKQEYQKPKQQHAKPQIKPEDEAQILTLRDHHTDMINQCENEQVLKAIYTVAYNELKPFKDTKAGKAALDHIAKVKDELKVKLTKGENK